MALSILSARKAPKSANSLLFPRIFTLLLLCFLCHHFISLTLLDIYSRNPPFLFHYFFEGFRSPISFLQQHCRRTSRLHQSTAASSWCCCPRPRRVRLKWPVGLPRGPQLPWVPPRPSIFRQWCPVNARRRAARTLPKIGCLSFFFCFPTSLCRLLVLLLLLISGNVYPNPRPIVACSPMLAGGAAQRNALSAINGYI